MKFLRRFRDMTPEQWAEHDAGVRAEREREEAARAADAQARALAALELPPRVLDVLKAGPRQTEAMKAIVDAGDTTLVCLSGNPGNGKTIAAAAWLLDRGVGLFVKAPQLARWERYSDAKMDRLLDTPALVIDDMGVEYQDVKGNLHALFNELLDHRYDHNLPVVMTTNLDAETFGQRYGVRVRDRIREKGAFMSIGAPSLRRAA